MFGLSGDESAVPLACASSTGATQTRRSGGRFRHSTRMLERRGRDFARQKWPKSGAVRADPRPGISQERAGRAAWCQATHTPHALHTRARCSRCSKRCAHAMRARCSRDDAVGHARCADAARHGEGYALVARRARGVGGEVWLDGLPRLVRVGVPGWVLGFGPGFGPGFGSGLGSGLGPGLG